jgi:hypothetical protein
MKLFKIELDNVWYDDYDSCIIVAESKEQVEELCRCNFVKYEDWDTEHYHPKLLCDFRNILSASFDIHNGQKWTITEIDINEIKQPTIICSDFNAG